MIVPSLVVVSSGVIGLAVAYAWKGRVRASTQVGPEAVEPRPSPSPGPVARMVEDRRESVRGLSVPGWDTRVVPRHPDGWWWNAWHEESETELSGSARTQDEAIEAMRTEIEAR